MDALQWILTIAPAAIRVGRKYKYPTSVLIGQTIDETGWGTRPLVSKANNVIGMKKELLPYESTTWDGSVEWSDTWEDVNGQAVTVQAEFRKYASYEDCLEDFCRFMAYGVDYDGSIKYGSHVIGKDVETVLRYLTGRYATDHNYGKKILKIIDDWGLRKFDRVNIPAAPAIADRIAINAAQVVEHNGNSHEFLAIHYRGVEGENPDLYGGGYGGHFDVTLTGQCSQAALVTDKIWHVGKGDCYEYIHPTARNANTIGIEISTFEEGGKWFFTEESQRAAAELAAWLMFVLNLPDNHLLRHGDITTKHCPLPYMDFEGQGSNWTWEQFKEEVKKNMRTHSMLRIGSTGEEVRKLQEGLRDLGFCNCQDYLTGRFADGDFGARTEMYVKCFQKSFNLDVDGIFGEKSWAAFDKAVAECNTTEFNFTAAEAVAAGIKVGDLYKAKGYKWNDAEVAPWLQPWVFTSSCDRGMDHLFDVAGICLGNREAKGIAARLQELGAKKLTDVGQIQAGDVIILNTWHIFMAASSRTSSGTYQRIDFGSDDRMKHGQPHIEPITDVLMILRPPYKGTDPEPEAETERKKYTVTIEQVKQGDYCPSVGLLQGMLGIKIDNDFGGDTDSAFRKWQAARIAEGKPVGGADGKPDGVCGRDSWTELLGIEVQPVD